MVRGTRLLGMASVMLLRLLTVASSSVAVGRALGGATGICVRPPGDVGETRRMIGDGRR